MRPAAYCDELATVHLGDAIELLRQIPEGSVDAVVTDPPYGEGAASWDRTSIGFHEAWLSAVLPLLKPDAPILAFASRRLEWQLCAAAAALGIRIRPQLAWVHRQGQQPAPDMPRIEHEPVVWLGGGLRPAAEEVRRMRSYAMRGSPLVQRGPANPRGFGAWTYRPHPAGPVGGTVFESTRRVEGAGEGGRRPGRKPTAVMAYFVALACPPDGVVLDPFCGTGATLAAAKRLGRRSLGIDADESVLPLLRRRLQHEVHQPALLETGPTPSHPIDHAAVRRLPFFAIAAANPEE